MAVVVDEFDYLCRLCAAKTGILMGLPIFESGQNLRNIDKKIAVCLPVQISPGDQLPKVVCESCAYKLDRMYDFREKCLRTDIMFVQMLKSIKVENCDMGHTLNGVEELAVMENGIGDIDSSGERVRGCIDVISGGGDECVDHVNSGESAIRTMRVMDDMDLAGGEQVVGDEEIRARENEIRVATIDCIDDPTTAVGIVHEHIREVTNDEIAMHLEEVVVGNLAAVSGDLSELGINYVSAIATDNASGEQMVDYGDNAPKYEEVDTKEEYDKLTPPNTIENHIGNENYVTTPENPPAVQPIITETDDRATECDVVVGIAKEIAEYTKRRKEILLNDILENPTLDETGSSWYLCPFCNKAATDPNSLVAHYEQHFCVCHCGLYFTSIEQLNIHEGHCGIDASEEIGESEEKTGVQAEGKEKKKIKERTKNERASTKKISAMNIGREDEEEEEEEEDEEEMEQETESKEADRRKSGQRQKWSPKICSQCGKQYRTNYKLQEHMRKHTGEKPYQCQSCEKAFRSKIGLAQHTATHTGEYDYKCSTCGKGFQCKSYLIVHQRVHSDLKPYPCGMCGQNFKTKQSLLDHENRHMGVKPYMCEICGRGFITKGLCKSHQKIHSGKDNRQYPCQVCNKMFVSKSYLNTHLRIHTGEKPYLCEVCGKGFLTRVDLKIHSTMHTGEKSFKCDVCSKVFARRAALRCHRRSHTGERPYTCDVCGKTFTQFSPMAIHKRIHTGERPYECDVCGKAFISRSTMMCHRKKHNVAAAASQSTTATSKDTAPVTADFLDNPKIPGSAEQATPSFVDITPD